MPKKRTRGSWCYQKNNFRQEFHFFLKFFFFTFAFCRLRWDVPFLVVRTVYIISVQKIRETWRNPRNNNQLLWCKIYWDLVQYAPIESLVWTFWSLFVCVCVCENLWHKAYDWPTKVGLVSKTQTFRLKSLSSSLTVNRLS